MSKEFNYFLFILSTLFTSFALFAVPPTSPPETTVQEQEEERPKFTPRQWQRELQTVGTTTERFVKNFPTYSIIKGTHRLSHEVLPTLKRFPIAIAAQLFGHYLQTKYIEEHTLRREGGLTYFQAPERLLPWSSAFFQHHLSLFGLTEKEFIHHFPFQPIVQKMRESPHLKLNKLYGYLPLPIQGKLHRREAAVAIENLTNDSLFSLQEIEESLETQGQRLLSAFFPDMNVERFNPQAYLEWYELKVSPKDNPLTLARKLTRFVLKVKDLPGASHHQELIHRTSKKAGEFYLTAMEETDSPAEKYDYGHSAVQVLKWARGKTPQNNPGISDQIQHLENQLIDLAQDYHLIPTPA